MAARDLVLITGSSGFLGEALAVPLAERWDVIGLDLKPPRDPSLPTIETDLTSDASVTAALAEVDRRRGAARIATVIHLAAYYDLTGENSPLYQKVTLDGTSRLLHGLRDRPVDRFVFASTMLVHAPCRPGERIDEDWPLDPAWPYPQSKVDAEALIRRERGGLPTAILRLAGIYDQHCHAAFLARQIAQIYERTPFSYLFAGDPSHGQPYLHLADLGAALVRLIERRDQLPEELVLLLGEAETPSYLDLQQAIGRAVHGTPWPTRALPKELARAGAWIQDDVLAHDPFIKPWMVEHADDHYALDIGRAERLLDWRPGHRLLDTIPAMARSLEADPPGWYRENKLDPSLVAAADPVLERVQASDAQLAAAGEPALVPVDRRLASAHRRTVWCHLANMVLGLCLIMGPMTHGLFDATGPLPPPPAAGHALAPAEIRNLWLGGSEILSGLLILLLSGLSLARRRSWAGWATSAVGLWVLMAPLVFWTTSAAAYAVDTLFGTTVIVLAVMVPPTPGVAREALLDRSDLPLGWSYSPSAYYQRLPIIALALIGLLTSRYLAAYQLGHIDGLWDPLFGGIGPEDRLNGSEAVVTSWVSKDFPIPDAGLGAVAYILDVLTGAIGDRRRWRTMPWLVLLFGLLILPLGAISVGFIIIQPTLIGTLCTLCLIQAVITVILIPYSLDEVLATIQFLWRSHRAGRPFWRTFFRGGPPLGESIDPVDDFALTWRQGLREFVTGGVTFPWRLQLVTAIGALLVILPLATGADDALAASRHIAGCLAITFAITPCADLARAARLLNLPLGLWVALAPFLLDAEAGGLAIAIDGLLGLALIVLSLPRGHVGKDHYGGWDRLIL